MKKYFKKYLKLHWLKRGVFVCPKDYKSEIEKIEYVRDYKNFNICNDKETMAANIRRYAHILEKGFFMPNRRVGFGKEKAEILIELLKKWDSLYEKFDDKTVNWAKEILSEYKKECQRNISKVTDIKKVIYSKDDKIKLKNFLHNRRSSRNFTKDEIKQNILDEILMAANYAPSSCNRQTAVIYVVNKKEDKKVCENLSSGGKGFAYLADKILIMCIDMSSYILPAERHLPYVDGGIYAQNIMLSAQIHGLSTCFLNWALQTKEEEKNFYQRFSIPCHFMIFGLMCMGYPEFIQEPPVRKELNQLVNYL